VKNTTFTNTPKNLLVAFSLNFGKNYFQMSVIVCSSWIEERYILKKSIIFFKKSFISKIFFFSIMLFTTIISLVRQLNIFFFTTTINLIFYNTTIFVLLSGIKKVYNSKFVFSFLDPTYENVHIINAKSMLFFISTVFIYFYC
jgi:hypothetical protein